MEKSFTEEMKIIKRNGNIELIQFDKILTRIKRIGDKTNIKLNFTTISMKVIDQLYDNITSMKIDELLAEQCASLSSIHPDYGILSSYIIISNHQKNTNASFSQTINELYNIFEHEKENLILVEHQQRISNLSSTFVDFVNNHKEFLDNIIDYERDYLIDYFGFKTLERSYLMKKNGKVLERIQHLWLRVSIAIHYKKLYDLELTIPDISQFSYYDLHDNNKKTEFINIMKSVNLCKKEIYNKIAETYNLMSQKYFTHATPTLFNAGTNTQQLSSCFLQAMEEDSLNGIYNTLKECAQISKYAGGIGLHIHNIRATGSKIRGTQGISTGIVPMLRNFNETALYVNQGGKRNGSIAIYLEPWHLDIELFLQLRKNHGEEKLRARDLFYALWIPDLFMRRVKESGYWTLLCPDECKGLADVFGDDFDKLYEHYENLGKLNIIKNKKTVLARDLWVQILESQMETGTPYLCYKDSVNYKSNQINIDIIKSSNLCSEIMEVSNKNETAVCNLASIALPMFIEKNNEGNYFYNFDKLQQITRIITFNLNNIIDINYYPTEKAKKSNINNRPIGIGVQGLADVFFILKIAFDSPEAQKLNHDIFETIYFSALEESCELARIDGYYSTYKNSPIDKGLLQFDLWNIYNQKNGKPIFKINDDRHNWTKLKEKIAVFGVRNSLLTALMPTASTSQILGFNECFEPITSNIYSRGTLAGQFIITNKYLMNDLIDLGLWNEKIKNQIVANKGSIQHLDLPENLKNIYKTVWEIKMKTLIDMSADRGPFICQSQSLNLFVKNPTIQILTSMHMYSWDKGLKTGIYYLRSQAKHDAQQFTIEPENKSNSIDNENCDNENCNNEICDMCSANRCPSILVQLCGAALCGTHFTRVRPAVEAVCFGLRTAHILPMCVCHCAGNVSTEHLQQR